VDLCCASALTLVFGFIEPFGKGPAEQLKVERDYFATSRRSSYSPSRLTVGALLFVPALLACSAGVVRRQAAMAVGGFDARLRVREDLDFFAFVVPRFGARYLGEVALHYRISSEASLLQHR